MVVSVGLFMVFPGKSAPACGGYISRRFLHRQQFGRRTVITQHFIRGIRDPNRILWPLDVRQLEFVADQDGFLAAMTFRLAINSTKCPIHLRCHGANFIRRNIVYGDVSHGSDPAISCPIESATN